MLAVGLSGPRNVVVKSYDYYMNGSKNQVFRLVQAPVAIAIAFAGSSPPRPLRHVAAGLGARPGEGKDISGM